MRVSLLSFVSSLLIMAAGFARADNIADKCESAKNRAAGQLAACLQKAEAGLAVKGDTAAFDKAVGNCTAKFSKKFSTAEQKAVEQTGICTTTGDEAAVRTAVSTFSDCIAGALEGDVACLLCGNGVVDAGEDCDLGDDGTGDCSTATGGAEPIGTVSCSPGCVYDTSDCLPCDDGANVGGSCWHLGAAGQSCASLCASLGREYSDETKSFAGSDGGDSNCDAVLTALGVAPGPLHVLASIGMGCWVNGTSRERDPSPTQPYTNLPWGQRACACR